jgi:hypothetical protein
MIRIHRICMSLTRSHLYTYLHVSWLCFGWEWHVPDKQLGQLVALVAAPYLPVGHDKHNAALGAPMDVENFPVGSGFGLDLGLMFGLGFRHQCLDSGFGIKRRVITRLPYTLRSS